MSLDQEYRIGIVLARNSWIIRTTRDQRLKSAVARDSAALRRQLEGAVA